MKICPTCNKKYGRSKQFCQDDGTELVTLDSSAEDEAPVKPKRPASRRVKRNRRFFLVLAAVLIGLFAASHLYSRISFNPKAASQAYQQIRAEHKIVDVHEHIQSINEVPRLLVAMDSLGIGKTILLGSSWFTITLDPKVGFTRYDENNE